VIEAILDVVERLQPASADAIMSRCGGLGGLGPVWHPADGDEMNLSIEAAATLARVFRSLGIDAEQAGAAVTVAGTQVTVASRINNRGQQANRHFLAAEFDISVAGSQ
jgi:hypothetical protein